MSKQSTNTVLMVEPTNFGFNEDAFLTNSFQNKPENDQGKVQEQALNEFRKFVEELRRVGVHVITFQDVENSTTPDSIFPNNWFSTHDSGVMNIYPMAVPNRRAERRPAIVEALVEEKGYTVKDYSDYESENIYLEGTGSMIFDHDNRCVYAALSPRTNKNVLNEVAAALGYSPISFIAYGKTGEPIYHTNVMMCIGQSFVAIGADTINETDRERVLSTLRKSGKEIILLSNEQVYNSFAGNMLQISNSKDERVLVLSKTAYNSLSEEQIKLFEEHNEHFVTPSIATIEYIGGGSARCMLAEIFE